MRMRLSSDSMRSSKLESHDGLALPYFDHSKATLEEQDGVLILSGKEEAWGLEASLSFLE